MPPATFFELAAACAKPATAEEKGGSYWLASEHTPHPEYGYRRNAETAVALHVLTIDFEPPTQDIADELFAALDRHQLDWFAHTSYGYGKDLAMPWRGRVVLRLDSPQHIDVSGSAPVAALEFLGCTDAATISNAKKASNRSQPQYSPCVHPDRPFDYREGRGGRAIDEFVTFRPVECGRASMPTAEPRSPELIERVCELIDDRFVDAWIDNIEDGHGHTATLAMSGMLAQAAWSEDDADFLIRAVGRAVGYKVRDQVSSTFAKLASGAAVTGRSTLAEQVGDEAARIFADAIRLRDAVEAAPMDDLDALRQELEAKLDAVPDHIKRVYVIAPMSCGKSFQLERKFNGAAKALWVVPTQALHTYVCGRLPEAVSYQRGNLDCVGKGISTFASARKFGAYDGRDVVILDEALEIEAQICSRIFEDKRSKTGDLQDLLTEPRRVYIAGADLTHADVERFERIAGDADGGSVVVEVTGKTMQRDIVECSLDLAWSKVFELLARARQGEHVAIFADTQRTIETIALLARWEGVERVLAVHGRSDRREVAKVNDPNAWNVLLANSAMASGVSIDDVLIDGMVCLRELRDVGMRSWMQQLGRARKYRGGEVFVGAPKWSAKSEPTDAESIYLDLFERWKNAHETSGVEVAPFAPEVDPAFYEIVVAVERRRRIEANEPSIRAGVVEAGWSWRQDETDYKLPGSMFSRRAEARKFESDVYAARVAEAPLLDSEALALARKALAGDVDERPSPLDEDPVRGSLFAAIWRRDVATIQKYLDRHERGDGLTPEELRGMRRLYARTPHQTALIDRAEIEHFVGSEVWRMLSLDERRRIAKANRSGGRWVSAMRACAHVLDLKLARDVDVLRGGGVLGDGGGAATVRAVWRRLLLEQLGVFNRDVSVPEGRIAAGVRSFVDAYGSACRLWLGGVPSEGDEVAWLQRAAAACGVEASKPRKSGMVRFAYPPRAYLAAYATEIGVKLASPERRGRPAAVIDLAAARRRRDEGASWAQLSREFGVPASTVRGALR